MNSRACLSLPLLAKLALNREQQTPQDCPAYDSATETSDTVVGTASGNILASPSQITATRVDPTSDEATDR